MKKTYIERTLELHNIYETKMLPILASHEPFRKKIASQIIYKYFLSILFFSSCLWITPLIFGICIFFDITNKAVIGMTTLLFLIAAFLLMLTGDIILKEIKILKQNFNLLLKVMCLEKILKIFENLEWKNAQNIIKDEELKNSGLFAEFNKRITDDEFQGVYQDINFKICETSLIYHTGSGRYEGDIDVFKGVVITFDYNKDINNRTIISPKGDLTLKNSYWIYIISLLPIIARTIKDTESLISLLIAVLVVFIGGLIIYKKELKKEEPLDSVVLEDCDFIKKYNVYSSDQVEARYIITPAFIERFKNFKTAFNSKKIKCAFYGKKLIIAISTNQNLFELGHVFKPLKSPCYTNSCYNQLSSIYKMIEYFKLTEKTKL